MEIDKHFEKLVELLRKEQSLTKDVVDSGNRKDSELFVNSIKALKKVVSQRDAVMKDIVTVRSKYLDQAQFQLCKALGLPLPKKEEASSGN